MQTYYDLAVAVGIFIGLIIGGFLGLFVNRINQFTFKKYYLKCDDKKKEQINQSLKTIEKELETLAEFTNTLLFKKYANHFSDFLNYLRKYWLN